MKTISRNFVARQLSSGAFTIAALAVSGCSSRAQDATQTPAVAATEKITSAQWLKTQTKPQFKPGHTLPRLSRFGWSLPLATRVELTENWGYALEFGGYVTDDTIERLKDPESIESKLVALSKSNPKKYPIGVILSRDEPPNPAEATFLRDAKGALIDGKKTYSPLNPQSVLDQMAELRARPMRALREKVPINIVLNGGEYGLGVLGFMQKYAEQDPAVVKAKGDMSWFEMLSKAKAQERLTIAQAVKKAVPNRELYIYYQSGNIERNRYGGWKEWSIDATYSQDNSDLPSNEFYYKHFNSGYLPDAGGNDMLTRALNGAGFQIKNGKKNSYDWLSSGWVYEADDHGNPLPPKEPKPDVAGTPELQGNNAAALVDPNAGQLSPINLYTGFLKCLFTSGTVGGNAGYYAFPIGGFDASFAPDKVPHWIPQMTALSQVQALFSYVEDDLRQGELLPGPNKHVWSKDQPAYEFPTGDPNVRVVARKRPDQKRWLLTAWAADGIARPVKVTIPELGALTLLARSAGSVYVATLKNNQPELSWLDANALEPTAKGFAPQKVTEKQILAALQAPQTPPQENLQLNFDAAQGVTKTAEGKVVSWKPGGALSDWMVNATPAGSPTWIADAINGRPAVRFSGPRWGLVSDALPAKATLGQETATIFTVYAGAFPQSFTAQDGNNNRLINTSGANADPGLSFSNGEPPVAGQSSWQTRMATVKMGAPIAYFALGGLVSREGELWDAFTFDGDIAEILIYRGELPQAQQAQVKLYLSAKYGVV